MRRVTVATVCVLALLVAVALLARRDSSSRRVPPLGYVELVTGSPAEPGESLPIVLGIHGLGDTPELFLRTFASEMPARVRMILPRAPTAYGDGFSWFEILGTSLAGEGFADGVIEAGERVATLIDTLTRDLHPPSPPIVFGYSQGGILSYYLAAKHPTAIAAALPIAGLLPPSLGPSAAPAATFAYHGARDELVPIDAARTTVASFRAAGGVAELREYPHLGHAISLALVRDVQAKLAEVLSASVK